MTKYFTIANGPSGTAATVVHQLHKASRAQARDDAAWMAEAAARARQTNGTPIRHHSPEVFLQDMIASGLLVALVNEEQ